MSDTKHASSRLLDAVVGIAGAVRTVGHDVHRDVAELHRELAKAGIKRSAALIRIERSIATLTVIDPGKLIFPGGMEPGGSSPGGSSPGGSSPGGSSPGGSSPGGSSPGGSSPGGSSPGGSSPGGSSPGGSSPGGSSPGGSSPGGSSPGGSSPGGSSPGGSSPGGSSPGGSSPGDPDGRSHIFDAFKDLVTSVEQIQLIAQRVQNALVTLRRENTLGADRLQHELHSLAVLDRTRIVRGIAVTSPAAARSSALASHAPKKPAGKL
jgi:hypothetical protein